LARHAWDNNHTFNWEEAKILHQEQHNHKRNFIEGELIKLHENPISQSSVEIRPLWVLLLKERPLDNNSLAVGYNPFNSCILINTQ
jgi:hypothetical protein